MNLVELNNDCVVSLGQGFRADDTTLALHLKAFAGLHFDDAVDTSLLLKHEMLSQIHPEVRKASPQFADLVQKVLFLGMEMMLLPRSRIA
jgi:hypothetical protein